MKKIRTILIGTSEFAVRIYERIYDRIYEKFEIVTVVTTPDKPIGRKQEMTPSPVKKWVLENNLKVLQPEKIADPEWIKRIQELIPELIIVCAYGQIIPKEILDIPKFGTLNIHPSLLPKYRGASPIQAAILNGDQETGVSLMVMDEEMDHGDIISNFQFPISNKLTYEELSSQSADIAAKLLITTLPDYVNGKIEPRPQDHSKATFTKIIKKEDGKIDWNKSAEEIERQIRAFHQWPGTFSFWNNKQLKILGAKCLRLRLKHNKKRSFKHGEVFLTNDKELNDKELAVQTGNEILIITEVQLEGKRQMSARDFLNGHAEIIGTILK